MYFLFDIGGTKIRFAVARGKNIERVVIVPTPKHFRDGMLLFRQYAQELSFGKKFRAAAGGIAGSFDTQHTKLFRSPNLPGWIGKPLKKELEKACGTRVLLENDADLAGLGEATTGAGEGKRIVAYLTISTGVGGVRIVDGTIERGAAMGFEPGGQIIDWRTERTLEEFISGSALQRRYKKKPEYIHDARVWEKEAHLLAIGLVNVIMHWSPEIIVLGGGLMRRGGISFDRVRRHVKRLFRASPYLPRIVRGALGDRAGLHGAFALLTKE